MPTRFTIPQIRDHMRKRFGREVSADSLSRTSTKLFGSSKPGQTKTLQDRDAIKLVNTILANAQKLNLSEAKKAEIATLLSMRAKSGPYKKEHLEDIARVVSHPKAPISVRMIRKLNEPVVKKMRKTGVNPKAGSYDKERASVLPKLRDFLAKNINASVADVTNHLGINYRTLQRIISKSKTTLDKERRSAKIKAVKDLDLVTKGTMSETEIAKRFGLKERYVREILKRGNSPAAKERVQRASSNFLFLLGYFTTPKIGTLSLDKLITITGVPRPVAFGAISELKRKRLIYEEGRDGSNSFCISNRGYRDINGHGANPNQRERRLQTMPLDVLEEMHQMLQNARLAGLKPNELEMQNIERVLGQKRLASFKQKNGF